MVEVASSKNATLGAFSPSEQREGARRVKSPEAMAIEGNLAGSTKLPNGSFNRLFLSIHGVITGCGDLPRMLQGSAQKPEGKVMPRS